MRYTLAVEGLEGHHLEVESGTFSAPKLLLDGVTAPKGAKRGQFLLRRNDGTEVIAQLKPTFLDTLPKVIIDGKPYSLGRPLKWYEMLWTGIPLLLYFFGGIIGAVIGLGGMALNRSIFRSERGGVAKYTLSAGVTFLSFFLQMLLATLAQLVIRRLR